VRWKWVAAAVLIIALVAVVRTWVVDVVSVSSDSMAPTVCTGDVVAVNKLTHLRRLRDFDIITFSSPEDGEHTIKRVVGLPGQRVAIEDGVLVIDGKVVDESYVDQATIDAVYFGPVTVPPASVFVMGDNREFSIDSRAYGPVAISAVDGRLMGALRSTCAS
jgi:signal peptidase I